MIHPIEIIPLKFSSSFDKLFASQAGVSRTGLAINGAFSTSLLLPSEKVKNAFHSIHTSKFLFVQSLAKKKKKN